VCISFGSMDSEAYIYCSPNTLNFVQELSLVKLSLTKKIMAISNSKLVLSVFLSALMILSTFTQVAKAKNIGNPALTPNIPGSGPPTPANPYGRGCNPGTRCRAKPPAAVKEEYKQH